MNTLKLKLESLTKLDLLQGKPIKAITLFAIPLMIGNLFQMFYSMVDTIVVGKCVGTSALAAVGASTPVTDLLLGLVIGLANGMSVVIAQKIGAKDKNATKKAIINGFYLICILSMIIMILGLNFNKNLFALIHVSPEIMSGALTYSSILFLGTFFAAIYNYECAILRAHGNSLIPLVFLIISAVLNVVLDLFFVVVCHLQIAGVAYATIIAQFTCSLLGYLYMKKSLHLLVFEKADYTFNRAYIKEHISIAMPMAFFSSLLAISFLAVQSALNTLGTDEIAAYSAAYKMDSMMIQILSGFGTAITTFTAQNYGQRAYQRIHQGAKDTLKITLSLSLIVALLAHFFSKEFMSLFVSTSEIYVINLGVKYISFTSCCYFILGINFVVRFILTGVGESVVPLGIGILEVFIRFMGTYFLIYPLGFQGMIYINPLCWFTSTSLILIFYPFLIKRAYKKNKSH